MTINCSFEDSESLVRTRLNPASVSGACVVVSGGLCHQGPGGSWQPTTLPSPALLLPTSTCPSS